MALRYVFQEDNKCNFYMDMWFWKGMPSDRIFYVKENSMLSPDLVELVAKGYGEKGDYGNGSIYIEKKLLPNPV